MTPQMQENIDPQLNHQVIVLLLKKIIELVGTKEDAIESLSVDNLDEIKAHLRNELLPVIKSIKSGSDRSDVLKAIKGLSDEIRKIDFNPTVNVSSPEVRVPEINIPEIKIPDITIPTFEIPIPQVNYTPPDIIVPSPIVNIEAPIVNIPEIELDEIINELSIGLKKLRHNNSSNPLFVRMADLNKILEALGGVEKASKEVMLGFPGSIRIQNSTGGTVDFNTIGLSTPTSTGSGKTTVTTAGTRVVLSTSQQIKSLTIKALSTNTGIIYVGNSAVSSTNGFQLSSGDSVSLDISNLNVVYIDSSTNSQSVTYMWVN